VRDFLFPISMKFRATLFLLLFSLLSLAIGAQDLPIDLAAKLLPNKLGDFQADGPASVAKDELTGVSRTVGSSAAKRSYIAEDGATLSTLVITAGSDAEAYAVLSETRRQVESTNIGRTGDVRIGTAGFSFWDGSYNNLYFFRGRAFVAVKEEGKSRGIKPLTDFATSLAEKIDRGEGDIPVLVKHLPNWEEARRQALYVVSAETLKEKFGAQSVFSVVDFGSGAEAVAANYGKAELVIVEFHTPQLATDNNGRITSKLQELRSQGQPAPTSYRRVGNYSVFVFNAPSQEAANLLIDQVKYEQMVQWLGENPYRYEQALRDFSETTLGVFVNVVKGSGLALVSCLAIGGLFGGLLFIRRRAQQREAEAYADSGAMLRLNLDDLTPETDPARLLGRGK
jgi:hypothetical protein